MATVRCLLEKDVTTPLCKLLSKLLDQLILRGSKDIAFYAFSSSGSC